MSYVIQLVFGAHTQTIKLPGEYDARVYYDSVVHGGGLDFRTCSLYDPSGTMLRFHRQW